ncbi:MAG: T9SS type A sorting domain-containing protein [Flavobacteriales bacterium]|nr:T9SS type A sorting domain-containing protein [Flavobacteriales bacterium]
MKLFFSLLFGVQFIIYSSAQTDPANKTLQQIVVDLDAYFQPLIDEFGEEALLSESSEYYHYLQWKNTWCNRYSGENTQLDIIEAELEYFQNRSLVLGEVGDWEELGPYKQPEHLNSSGNYSFGLKGIGPLNFITFDYDYDNSERILTGGWNSGLFVSDDGGATWDNAGTDQLVANISAADCEISPFDSDVWFLATGNGDGFFNNDQFYSEARCLGLFRSVDAGENWELIGDDFDLGGDYNGEKAAFWQIKEVKCDPSTSQSALHLYVTTNKGVYRTTNAMADASVIEWELVFDNSLVPSIDQEDLENLQVWAYDLDFLPDPGEPCTACNTILITVSLKMSGTYLKNDVPTDYNEYAARIYVSNPSDPQLTGSFGTWELLEMPDILSFPSVDENNNIARISIETSPASPNEIFCWCIQIDEVGEIAEVPIFITYNFNTESWSETLGSSEAWTIRGASAFAVSPEYSGIVYGSSGIYIAQWNSVNNSFDQITGNDKFHVDVEYLEFSPDGQYLFVVTHGGIYRYDLDNGLWQPMNEGLGCSEPLGYNASKTDRNLMLVGLNHDGSMRSIGTLNTNTWNWKQVKGGDGQQCAINWQSNLQMYTSGQESNHRRSDDAYSTEIDVLMNVPGTAPWNTQIELNSFNPDIVYSVSSEGSDMGIYRHNYKGSSVSTEWVKISDFNANFALPPGGGLWNPLTIWLSEASPDLIFCFAIQANDAFPDDYALFMSNKARADLATAQESWVKIPFPGIGDWAWVSNVLSDPNDPEVFYVVPGHNDMNTDMALRIIQFQYGGNILNGTIDVNQLQIADITDDLPNVVINQLYIMPGSGEKFACTKMGVFYTDSDYLNGTGTIWHEYGTELPFTDITALIPHFSTNKVRCATFGRGIWENDLPCSKLEEQIVIASGENVIWNHDMRFRQDIVVKNGGVLHLTSDDNAVTPIFYFAEHCGIIVEVGGRLEIDNVVLTNACPGSLWLGIQVWGDPDNHQLYPYTSQGYVKLTDATIQNAHTAVWLTKVLLDGGQCTTDPDFGGGVVQAKGTQFLDNYIDAQFFPYNWELAGGDIAPNASHFYDCDFITTKVLEGFFQPQSHLILDDITGLRIEGCRFNNEAVGQGNLTWYYNEKDKRGNGIESNQASFKVRNYCTLNNDFDPECEGDIIESTFDNLNVAILAVDGTASRTFEVNDARFGYDGFNFLNIGAIAFDIGPTIVYNDMKLGPLSEDDQQDLFGIFVIASTGFEIEENEITSTTNDENYNLIGILNQSCFQNSNRVYHNQFNGLDYAVHAQENNGYELSGDQYGLVYECNQFAMTSNNQQRDIVLANFASINPVQASYETGAAAGNQFSHWCPQLDVHTDIELGDGAEGFTYHSTNDVDEVPENGCYPDGIGEVSVIQGFPTNQCLVSIGGGELPSDGELAGMALFEEDLVTTARELYNGTIDQGNTAGLVAYINNTGHTSMEVRNEMLASSPHVSDLAFRSAFMRTPAMDPWHLAQVLLMNSPLKPAVQAMMIQYNYDEYYRELVMNGQQGGMTYKTLLETDMAHHHVLYEVHKNDYLRRKLLDDEVMEPQAIIDFLEIEPRLNERFVLAGMYCSQGEYTAAIDALGTCTMGGTVDPACRAMEIYIQSCMDGLQCPRFSTAQQAELELLASQTWQEGWVYAAALLRQPMTFEFRPPTHLRSSRMPVRLPELHLIEVQPNPTSGSTWFSYQMPTGAEKVELEILDPLGNTVFIGDITYTKGLFEWQASNLASGLYLFNFRIDGILLESGKVTVIH